MFCVVVVHFAHNSLTYVESYATVDMLAFLAIYNWQFSDFDDPQQSNSMADRQTGRVEKRAITFTFFAGLGLGCTD